MQSELGPDSSIVEPFTPGRRITHLTVLFERRLPENRLCLDGRKCTGPTETRRLRPSRLAQLLNERLRTCARYRKRSSDCGHPGVLGEAVFRAVRAAGRRWSQTRCRACLDADPGCCAWSETSRRWNAVPERRSLHSFLITACCYRLIAGVWYAWYYAPVFPDASPAFLQAADKEMFRS